MEIAMVGQSSDSARLAVSLPSCLAGIASFRRRWASLPRDDLPPRHASGQEV